MLKLFFCFDMIRNKVLFLNEMNDIQKPFSNRKAIKIYFFEILEKGKRKVSIQTSNTNTAAVKLIMMYGN